MDTNHCVGLDIEKREDLDENVLSMSQGETEVTFSDHLLNTKYLCIMCVVITNLDANALR